MLDLEWTFSRGVCGSELYNKNWKINMKENMPSFAPVSNLHFVGVVLVVSVGKQSQPLVLSRVWQKINT